jgi:exodeoxyribonuclease VII large subunit
MADLAHGLTAVSRTLIARRRRRVETLSRELDTYDLRHRLASVRARLVASDGGLRVAVDRQRQRAGVRLATNTARLESLSPLGVLARGYAVCWNADRTAVIHDAARLTAGETVRVTLARGEARCTVAETTPGRNGA